MKRRKFIATTGLASLAATGMTKPKNIPETDDQQLYEMREYEMNFRGNRNLLLSYFEDALIPALGRIGVSNVGVFEELGKSMPSKIYLLIPFNSMKHFSEHYELLSQDKEFQKGSTEFNSFPPEAQLFNRYVTELMIAFKGMPVLKVPDYKERIFEVRQYEGYNDDAVRRKIMMFDDEEIDLFYKTKLNPVFFGKVISGYNLPKLTYMLHFKNLEERDLNWKTFFEHPEWKRMLNDPKYANTVSRIDRRFLKPLEISQI